MDGEAASLVLYCRRRDCGGALPQLAWGFGGDSGPPALMGVESWGAWFPLALGRSLGVWGDPRCWGLGLGPRLPPWGGSSQNPWTIVHWSSLAPVPAIALG